MMPAPLPVTEEARADQARVLIEVAINDIRRDLPYVIALEDSRQSSTWVMTEEAAAAADAQAKKDRDAHARNTKLGVKITGPIVAPANVSAVSIEAEYLMLLRGFVRAANRAGLPKQWSLHSAGGAAWMAEQVLRALPHVRSVRLLDQLARDLQRIAEAAHRLVTGTSMGRLRGVVCPHCRLPSLLIDWDAVDPKRPNLGPGVIRCDTDAVSRRRQACVCSDPLCGCKRDPLLHRHAWWRARGKSSDGWWALGDRLGVAIAAAGGDA